MTYLVKNFKTAKEVKTAIKLGNKLQCYEPGLGQIPENGTVYLEGPHFPAPHSWYLVGTVENYLVVKVK